MFITLKERKPQKIKEKIVEIFGTIVEGKERIIFTLGDVYGSDGYFQVVRRDAMLRAARVLGVDSSRLKLPEEPTDITIIPKTPIP